MTTATIDPPAIVAVRDVIAASPVPATRPATIVLQRNPHYRELSKLPGAVKTVRGMKGGIFMTPGAARAFAILLDPAATVALVLAHCNQPEVAQADRSLWEKRSSEVC